MKVFVALLIGIILGGVAYWFMQDKARQHPASEQRFEESAARAGAAASDAARNLADAFRAKFETLDLRSNEVTDEMARSGKIIRRKAREIGGQVADAATDARIIAEIKAKFAADPELSVWSISVSVHEGHVELTGTVPTSEGVSRAVALALEPDGVADVTSTLSIKPK